MKKWIAALVLTLALCLCASAAVAVVVTNETGLKEAAAIGYEIELGKDIKLTSPLYVNQNLHIDGKGYMIHADNVNSLIRVNDSAHATPAEHVFVNLKNLVLLNQSSQGRCIDTRAGGSIEVALNNCMLTANGTNAQPITIGGARGSAFASFSIADTHIDSGESGYGIIAFVPVDLTMTGGSLTGWNALYAKPDAAGTANRNTYFGFENVEIECRNEHTGEDDSFAAIVIDAEHVSVSLNNCNAKTVQANDEATQSLVLFTENANSGFVFLKGEKTTVKGPLVYSTNTDPNEYNTVVLGGGTFDQNPAILASGAPNPLTSYNVGAPFVGVNGKYYAGALAQKQLNTAIGKTVTVYFSGNVDSKKLTAAEGVIINNQSWDDLEINGQIIPVGSTQRVGKTGGAAGNNGSVVQPPRTGDDSSLLLWAVLMMTSVAGMIVIGKRRFN